MTKPAPEAAKELDAIVIGAGWAGMYMLFKLRGLGLRARILEAGGGVGGTWYWNRYPGARCDIPILNYAYLFSTELAEGWTWSERYAAQPEIEQYANYVADRLDLRNDIEFNCRVLSAAYDAVTARWTVETDTETTATARYCIMATGSYSEPVTPDIPGIDTFNGPSLYTAKWPADDVDFEGKRVGVIGTGASGMQVISTLGRQPLKHLYVFQRTASFATPAHNRPMQRGEVEAFSLGLEEFRERARTSGSGMVQEGPIGPIAGLPDTEFEARMNSAMQIGGPSVLGGVADLMADEAANERVAEFLRRNVRERVSDAVTAEILCATGYALGARRILCESEYFETYNRDNVTLVDVRNDPIVAITDEAVQTRTSEYELDALVFATGFDSGTGAVLRIDVRGRTTTLADKWDMGPSTYLGIMTQGFPNLFMIAGPGSPSIRSNVMVSIEQHVEWISSFIDYLEDRSVRSVEPSSEAEHAWTEHVAEAVNSTLLARDKDTQYFGANIKGKPSVYLAYVGGVDTYRIICDDVRLNGYEGFIFETDPPDRMVTSPTWSGPRSDGTIKMRFETSII